MIEDLATIDDFALDADPLLARADSIEFSARALIMLLLVVAMGTDWYAKGRPFWSSLVLGIGVGAGFGLIVALLSYFGHWTTRRSRRRRALSRAFSSDPVLVPPPPDDASARLLSAVLLPRRQFAGGFLYVCRSSLIFQQHHLRRNWWRPVSRRAPDPIVMAPLRTITLEEGHLTSLPFWRRPIGSRPLPLILCSWQDGMLAIWAPRVPLIQARLQDAIDAMRLAPQAAV